MNLFTDFLVSLFTILTCVPNGLDQWTSQFGEQEWLSLLHKQNTYGGHIFYVCGGGDSFIYNIYPVVWTAVKGPKGKVICTKYP